MADNDNKTKGFLAAIFGAAFGAAYGVAKAAGESRERKKEARDDELARLRRAIDELFLEGKDEATIVNALMLSAREQRGDLPEKEIEMIKGWVREEKEKLNLV